MTEKQIQSALRHYLWPKTCIPNVHLMLGEQDMVAVTRTLYAHEYEIKCTRDAMAKDEELKAKGDGT